VAERELGVPVLSTATATVFDLLRRLELEPTVPDAGSLLVGLPASRSA
jgi:maleate isomerase